MNRTIDCFFVFNDEEASQKLVNQFNESDLVRKVYVLTQKPVNLENCELIVIEENGSCSTIRQIAKMVHADYAILALGGLKFEIGQGAIERLIQVAENTDAPMVYADYFERTGSHLFSHPVIDYQIGSLREDFNFGPVRLYRAEVLKAFRYENYEMLKYAGCYALRLRASRMGELVHIPEYLFTLNEIDKRPSGEKQFDYVRSAARERTLEMEQVCTAHLRHIRA